MDDLGPLPSSTIGFDADELGRMIEQVWDPIIAIDATGAIQFFNGAAEEMFGYTAGEVLGNDVHTLLAPEQYADDVETGMAAFRDAGDGPILGGTRELDAKRGDGTTFPIELTVDAFRLDDGLYAVAVVRDISERAALEATVRNQRDWAEQYFDLSGTLMIELDTDGRVKRINERGRRLLGYDTEELVGVDWFDRVVPGDAPVQCVEEIVSKFEDRGDEIEVHENRVETKAGERRTIKWHNTLLRDDSGSVTSILSSGSDITERRQQEALLRRQNERLDEFASVVSHDLRNPLNVAAGRATLLDESIDSPHLELLLEALDRIEEIVENTLTLARDGETVSDFAPVELADIAGRCWGMVETAEASLSIDGTRTIHGDVDRLSHLFENLFRNAVEHGSPNTLMDAEHGVEADRSPVTVRVGLLADGGFYVADDGPGIPAEQRESTFDPGYTSSADGTGFGLAICRRIVEAHGWEIRVIESDTGGARFEISGNESTD